MEILVKLKRNIESKKFDMLITKDTIIKYDSTLRAIIHPRNKKLLISVTEKDFETVK
jgi:hypothetical protein